MKKRITVSAEVTICETMDFEIDTEDESVSYEDWQQLRKLFTKALTDKYGWVDFDEMDIEFIQNLD